MTETAEANEKSAAEEGCYIYGIFPEDVQLSEGARGVGDPPAEVRLVPHRSIAAVVSKVRTDRPLGRPEDLTAHQQLLDASSAETPVLPMRFGAVVTNEQAVVDELLEPYHDEFAAALKELEGRAEYVVKGRYVEDAILREVLEENPDAASLREQIKSAGDQEATRQLRMDLGELINLAIEAKREADTRKVGDAVAESRVASSVRPPSHEEDAANVALLVETDRQADLERAVERLAREWEGRVTVRLLGPMAPYDFVVTQAPQE
jgi:hypothetical protein